MNMAKVKLFKISLFSTFMLFTIANGQGLSNFLGHWTGLELLESPNLTYDNRNISLVVSEGGDRDGFHIYTSSCDFLYNEDLDWAYHYFGFDKEYTEVIFLRRFITPLGVLGFEELVYDLTEWSEESFVAEYVSNDGATYHQIRMDIDLLSSTSLTPCVVKLSQNFPNPFNPSTKIQYGVPKKDLVSIVIHDVVGRHVKTLVSTEKNPGFHEIQWDATLQSSGLYIIKMQSDRFIDTQKLMLIK